MDRCRVGCSRRVLENFPTVSASRKRRWRSQGPRLCPGGGRAVRWRANESAAKSPLTRLHDLAYGRAAACMWIAVPKLPQATSPAAAHCNLLAFRSTTLARLASLPCPVLLPRNSRRSSPLLGPYLPSRDPKSGTSHFIMALGHRSGPRSRSGSGMRATMRSSMSLSHRAARCWSCC